MNIVNIADVPEEFHSSPKGNYQVIRKHLSLAAGGLKDVGVAGGGQPFDVELACIPAGKAAWLFHAHSSQWETFIIISGTGTLRLEGDETRRVRAGDFIIHPPGECHQLINDSDEELRFYVIADNPVSDVVRYPDSGKCFVKPLRKVFRDREAGENILEGEE